MKRFHVHIAVDDLAAGIRFYTAVFGTAPSVSKPEYAKWMLDDPRVNFAISRRGHAPGVNHLGIQVESDEALKQMRDQLQAADSGLLEQTGASCCYARSDKYWVTDPAGIPWETFHSLGDVPVYGDDTKALAEGACCVPLAPGQSKTEPSGRTSQARCCV